MTSPQSGVGTVHTPGAIGAIPARPTAKQLARQMPKPATAPKPTAKARPATAAPRPARLARKAGR